MPRPCSVCTSPDRAAVDTALLGGGTNRRIAAQFAASDQAIRRHRAEHLPERLAQAEQAKEAAEAVDLLNELRILRAKAYSLLLAAERAGDYRTAFRVREARGCLELLAEVEGRLDRRPTLNLLVAPEWVTVRSTLLEALLPYPVPAWPWRRAYAP